MAAAAVGGVRDELGAEVCQLCGAIENLRLCGRCGKCYYCSKEHQVTDWKSHKKQCHVLKSKTPTSRSAPKCQNETANIQMPLPLDDEKLAGKATSDNSRRPLSLYGHRSDNISNMGGTCTPQNEKQDFRHESTNQPTDPFAIQTNGMGKLSFYLEEEGLQQRSGGDDKTNPNSYEQPQSNLDCTSLKDSIQDRDSYSTFVESDRKCSLESISSNSSFGDGQKFSNMKIDVGKDIDSPCSSSSLSSDSHSLDNAQTCARHQTKQYSVESFYDNKSTGPTTTNVVSDSLTNTLQGSDVSTRPQLKGKRRVKGKQAPEPSNSTPACTSAEETKLADYVVKCLNDYGICVIDNFMSLPKADSILNEVLTLRDSGHLKDGQTVQQAAVKKIRGDQIAWIEKGDEGCDYIGNLISRLDALIMSCDRKLGNYNINGRTKAMVACYPGNGTGYKRHIDNPKGDGRCVTCIYYLNKDWNVQTDGGLLRIFPVMFNQVADIEPKFDRLLFFWSDRRNPHEVQPAYKMRFAITVWYFDAEQRKKAKLLHKIQGLTQAAADDQPFEEEKSSMKSS